MEPGTQLAEMAADGSAVGNSPAQEKRAASCRLLPLRALLLLSAVIFLAGLAIGFPAVNEFRVADSFRLVGKIDFPTAFRYFSQSTGFGRNEYRPVVMLTYAVDNFLWGSRPQGYHFTNVLLHAVNGVLVLFLFLRLTGDPLLSLCAALLFLLHPTHHSRVAWIAARDSSVCLTFFVVAWLLYLGRRASPFWERRQSRSAGPAFLASMASFALALMSYEGAVSLPFILLAMELFRAGPEAGALLRISRAARAVAPYFVLLAVYVCGWCLLFHGQVGAYDLDLSAAGKLRDFYRLHYRLFYGMQHWAALAYLAAAYLVWRARRSNGQLIIFSLLVLWLGYLPFVAVRGFADRFAFVSSLGVVLLLCVPLRGIPRRMLPMRPASLAPAVLVLFFLGYYTDGVAQRLRHWVNAGAQASAILSQVRASSPQFPPSSRLVFEKIPAMYGEAYVFPVGFRTAVRDLYQGVPLEIEYSNSNLAPAPAGEQGVYRFAYLEKEHRLIRVEGR